MHTWMGRGHGPDPFISESRTEFSGKFPNVEILRPEFKPEHMGVFNKCLGKGDFERPFPISLRHVCVC